MENYANKIINELSLKLATEREKLIKERLIEKLGYDVDLNEETKRRFSRILREIDAETQNEDWYWNDGSQTGLHLISFYGSKNDVSVINTKDKYIFEIGIKYK